MNVGVPAVTFLVMTIVGLDLTRADFERVRSRPRVLAAGLLGPLVLLPPVALAVLAAVPMPDETRAGLLLLAVCPVGGISNTYNYLARASFPAARIARRDYLDRVTAAFHRNSTKRRMERTMTKTRISRSLLATGAVLISAGFLGGCGVPKELTAADQAIADARKVGKDKDCPELFAAAEKLKNDAFAVCTPCDTKKAIELANESMARAKALCPPKPVPPPPPVVKAPPAAPAMTFAADPASVKQGGCSTLSWTTSNAAAAVLDQGVGTVDLNGSKKVCPEATTTYKLLAKGEGGMRDASATVTVVPRVIDRLTLHANFATNKATMLKADDADVEKAVEFLKKYPTAKFELEGHTDSTGPKAYNQTLSEKRAEAVKERLVKRGIDPARIHAIGFGDTKPVGDNKTVKGRAENRRVEVLILSE